MPLRVALPRLDKKGGVFLLSRCFEAKVNLEDFEDGLDLVGFCFEETKEEATFSAASIVNQKAKER